MKKVLFAAAGLVIALALACSSATPFSTANPTATTAPTVAPAPVQKWELREIAVDGSTVRVSLYVYAGVDVDVTIDRNPPSRVDATVPILEFVFEGLAAGEHPVLISDVIGHSESESVMIVEALPHEQEAPDWLAKWVADLEAGAVEFPPRSITGYEYQGKTVYYVLKECCDQFSDLSDAAGNLIGHPDGGITGRDDGFTVFSPENLKGEEVWLRR